MQGKAHILFGLTTGAITALTIRYQDAPTIACLLIGTIAGSVYPDIDNAESTISNRCPLVSKPFYTFFEHRGFIHSLANVLILMVTYWLCEEFIPILNTNFILASFLLYAMYKILRPPGILLKVVYFIFLVSIGNFLLESIEYFVYGFFIGMIGHIFCDMFTKKGVKLFWPFGKYISFRNVESGTIGEFVIVLAFSIIYFAAIKFANIL